MESKEFVNVLRGFIDGTTVDCNGEDCKECPLFNKYYKDDEERVCDVISEISNNI